MTKFSKKHEVSVRGQKYLPHLANLEELGTFKGCKVRAESYNFHEQKLLSSCSIFVSCMQFLNFVQFVSFEWGVPELSLCEFRVVAVFHF